VGGVFRWRIDAGLGCSDSQAGALERDMSGALRRHPEGYLLAGVMLVKGAAFGWRWAA